VPWIEGTLALDSANERSRGVRGCARLRALRAPARRPARAEAPRHDPGLPRHAGAARAFEADRARGSERPRGRAPRDEVAALLDRRPLAAALTGPARRGEIDERPCTTTPRSPTCCSTLRSGEALCVVDLDTTMPGFAPHDFGDLVRSAVSDSAEDEPDLGRIRLRLPVYRRWRAASWRARATGFRRAERSLLVAGALVIVYEQAIRFLADYLNGDRYYRTTRPGHNLDRARTQLAAARAAGGRAPRAGAHGGARAGRARASRGRRARPPPRAEGSTGSPGAP
jgi:hypothetical protein